MRKVIAAVLLTGGMLVACTLYVSEDATRIGPDEDALGTPGSTDGRHGRRDAGVLDGGAPGDGPLSSDCGVPPDDGPLPPPDDGPLPPDDGPRPPPHDGPRPPPHDGPRPHDGPLPTADGD